MAMKHCCKCNDAWFLEMVATMHKPQAAEDVELCVCDAKTRTDNTVAHARAKKQLRACKLARLHERKARDSNRP